MTDLDEKYISISDVQTFLSCRERWDMSSSLRQSLRHKYSPRTYLTEGSAFHTAIDANGKGEDWQAAVRAYNDNEREVRHRVYREKHGIKPWPMEMQKFEDSAAFVEQLSKQYFDHYGTENHLADQGLTTIATEVAFKIPLEGYPNTFFCGTFDEITVDDSGRLFLVEHKTYSSKPDLEELRFHFQITGYAVAFQWLTGLELTGYLYNGTAKRLITTPKVLKSGRLSTDKRQSVTYESYLNAIKAIGHDPGGYADFMTMLRERETQGDDRFFFREKFYFNETQLGDWFYEFNLIVDEMLSDPRIYRTVPFNGCGKTGADCWFRDLCHTRHSGGDVDLVLEGYTTGTYGTVEAVSNLEPFMVSSVEELIAVLRSSE